MDPVGRCSASGVKSSALDLKACRRQHTREKSVSQTTQAASPSLLSNTQWIPKFNVNFLSLPLRHRTQIRSNHSLIGQALTELLLGVRHCSRHWDTSLLPWPLHANGGDSNIKCNKLVKIHMLESNQYYRRKTEKDGSSEGWKRGRSREWQF